MITSTPHQQTRQTPPAPTGPHQASPQLHPMLAGNRDLPGPLSMKRLNGYGAVHQLDDTNGYLADYSDTLFGRGLIMSNIVPHNSVACLTTAAWVWLSGPFPDTINIVSASHHRVPVYGRTIKTTCRKLPEGHISQIAGLKLTSPTRTTCDIALQPDSQIPRRQRNELACSLMQEYHVDPVDCLDIIADNRHWANASQARTFFKTVEHCF
jgi:hypothetical protein